MRCQLVVVDMYLGNIDINILKNYPVSFEETKPVVVITTAIQTVIDEAPNLIQTKKELGPI